MVRMLVLISFSGCFGLSEVLYLSLLLLLCLFFVRVRFEFERYLFGSCPVQKLFKVFGLVRFGN